MSEPFVMIPLSVEECKELTQSAKSTYGALLWFARDDDSCYPGINAIRKRIGRSSTNTVRNALRLLQKRGFIEIEHRKKPNGEKDTHLYRIVKRLSETGSKQDDRSTDPPAPPPSNRRDREKHAPERGDDGFEAFWQDYPRKVGKDAARRAWSKLNPNDDLVSMMLEALKKHKRLKQWQDREYIPYPATWLNAGQWDDEILPEDAIGHNPGSEDDDGEIHEVIGLKHRNPTPAELAMIGCLPKKPQPGEVEDPEK